jgi:hypothetical protein
LDFRFPQELIRSKSKQNFVRSCDWHHKLLEPNDRGFSAPHKAVHIDCGQVLELGLIQLANQHFVALLVLARDYLFQLVDYLSITVNYYCAD